MCAQESGLDSTASYIRIFRGLVVCNTAIMLLTWIVNFNPSIQFNLKKYPVLCVTNVISWIDLIMSLIGDIYLKFPNCDCCSKSREASSDDEEDEDEDKDEDEKPTRVTQEDEESGRSPASN